MSNYKIRNGMIDDFIKIPTDSNSDIIIKNAKNYVPHIENKKDSIEIKDSDDVNIVIRNDDNPTINIESEQDIIIEVEQHKAPEINVLMSGLRGSDGKINTSNIDTTYFSISNQDKLIISDSFLNVINKKLNSNIGKKYEGMFLNVNSSGDVVPIDLNLRYGIRDSFDNESKILTLTLGV